MKIFNISLHRSATSSFVVFCARHGLRHQHWPGEIFDQKCRPALATLDTSYVWNLYKPLIETADVFADIPMPILYRDAQRDYPQAKFVIMKRDPAGWVKSVRKHCHNRTLDVLERLQYHFVCGRPIISLDQLSDSALTSSYERFIDNALNYLILLRADVKIFDVQKPTLAVDLAKFLCFDPKIEFPILN